MKNYAEIVRNILKEWEKMIDWWMGIKNMKELWRLDGEIWRKIGIKMRIINYKYKKLENEKWMENGAKNMKIMMENDRREYGD